MVHSAPKRCQFLLGWGLQSSRSEIAELGNVLGEGSKPEVSATLNLFLNEDTSFNCCCLLRAAFTLLYLQ